MNSQQSTESAAQSDLAGQPEWRKFLRHFEFDPGFAFIILLTPNRATAQLCQTEFEKWLRARSSSPLVALSLRDPDQIANLPEQLMSMPPPAGPLWADGAGARSVYEDAWNRCAVKLNRARDVIAARFATPVILVGSPWLREVLRDAAPDFWSVRAFISEISTPPAAQPENAQLPSLLPAEERHGTAESSFDPDLALRAIADLRGKPGQERQLSFFLDRAATALMNRGRSAEALSLCQEALALDEAALRQEPGRADYQLDLSVSYERMGDLHSALGEGETACQYYENSIALREQLMKQEPERADYQLNLSVAYRQMGGLHSALGDLDAAGLYYEKSLSIAEQLAKQETGRADYQRDLSVSYIKMGDVQRAQGEGEAARQYYEKSLAIAEQLVKQEPGRADFQCDLSAAYDRLGDLQRAQGESEAARQHYEKALAISEQLAKQEPWRADYQRDLIVSMVKLGTAEKLQIALNLALTLQQTNRLNKADEWMIADIQNQLHHAKSTST